MRGARSCSARGEAALEHVGRLDEVVVDRDDRVADLRGSGPGAASCSLESQSLDGSGLAALSTSGVAPSASVPSPAFVTSTSRLSSAFV